MRLRIDLNVYVLLLGASMACASGGGRASGANCQLSASDSVYLQGGPVYRDCAVDARARLLDERVTPDFQPSSPQTSGRQCYSAVIEFVVDTAGIAEVEAARVARTNDQSFADALIRMVPRLRYHPARKNDMPVRQIVQFSRAVALVAVPAGQVPRASASPPC